MSDFLQKMARSSKERAEALNCVYTDDALDRPVHPIQLNGFDLIAEIKGRSPAEGQLTLGEESRADRTSLYAEGGAAAISVLTEPHYFDGKLSHLSEVVDAVGDRELPVMRKDFLVSIGQILEAKAAGASGILLIVAMLDQKQLTALLDCAFEHKLFVLLESFSSDDLGRTARLLERPVYLDQARQNKLLVGVNTRDLRSLAVDSTRLSRLNSLIPAGTTGVAESGLKTVEDACQAVRWGYQMVLVGTALMRTERPDLLIQNMLASGRNA